MKKMFNTTGNEEFDFSAIGKIDMIHLPAYFYGAVAAVWVVVCIALYYSVHMH